MGDMLIDDPETIPPGSDDKAFVNLAQRAKIGKSGETLGCFRDFTRERAMVVGDGRRTHRLEGAKVEARFRRGARVQGENRQVVQTFRNAPGVRQRLEALVLDALRKIGE